MTSEPPENSSVNTKRKSCKLRDSRSLSYGHWGATSGRSILYFHGLPGSSSECALWHDAAMKQSIRLIAPDRPGLGQSDRDANRSLVDYPLDVAEMIAQLGISEYGIIGVSGGGMYALACAARKDLLPGLQSIGVVAGLGPCDLTQAGMGIFQKFAFLAMRWVPRKLVEWLWDLLIGRAARNPDPTSLKKALRKGLTSASGPDAELGNDDQIVDACTQSLRGAFTQGSAGYVDEAVIVSKPWGFNFSDITVVPVRLWYGQADSLAPAATGLAIAEKIPNAVCKVYDKETHTGVAIRHQQEILSSGSSTTKASATTTSPATTTSLLD